MVQRGRQSNRASEMVPVPDTIEILASIRNNRIFPEQNQLPDET